MEPATRTTALLATLLLGLSSCAEAPEQRAAVERSDGAAPGGEEPEVAPDGTVERDATVDPSRMVVHADRAAPGSLLEVSFPGGMTRGPGFTIDRFVDDRWLWAYVVSSDTDDPAPLAWAVDPHAEREWESGPAFGGRQPHRIPVPDDAAEGTYRICTAPGSVVCVEVEVDRDAPVVQPAPRVAEVVTLTAGPVTLVAHAAGTTAAPGRSWVDGTLAWDDDRGCFTLQGWRTGLPVVWPVGTRLVPTDPPQVELADGTVLQLGDELSGPGGVEVPERVPVDLPPRCSGSRVAVFEPDATVEVLPPVEE